MSKGVMYIRVSTKEQVEKTSLEMQERECQKEARKNGVVISPERIFVEKGESAKVVDRTELKRMLNFLKSHKDVEYLYIWKIDRLSRNINDYYGLKLALARYKVSIVSVTEPIEDDPVGRFLEAMLAASAQFDNEIRTLRTTAGMTARVKQGYWPHKTPIGYIKENGKIKIDIKTAPIIKELLIKFSNGNMTYKDAREFLYQKGIKTKSNKRKSADYVKNHILKNYLYAGYTTSKLATELNKGMHKAIVDKEIIDKNIRIISGKVTNYSVSGDEAYPLRGGFLLCKNCGLAMTGAASTGRGGKRYPLYKCSRKQCAKSITGKSSNVSVDKVHKDFSEFLNSFAPLDEKCAKLYKEIVVRNWNNKFKENVENLERIERKILDLNKYESQIVEKFIKDQITVEQKKQELEKNRIELEEYEEEKRNLDNYIENSKEIIENAMLFISDPATFWNRASLSVKKDIQHLIAPNGVRYDVETGFETADITFLPLLINKKNHKNGLDVNLVISPGIEPRFAG